jgi:ABC-type sugar transport system substrate-binding protein
MDGGVMRLVALATVLLAGCAGPPKSTLGFCQAQAEASPAVKALVISSTSNPYFMSQNSELIARTKANAVRDCMRRQGVIPTGGGVEAPAHPDNNSDTLLQK